jgi:hypothetical protein
MRAKRCHVGLGVVVCGAVVLATMGAASAQQRLRPGAGPPAATVPPSFTSESRRLEGPLQYRGSTRPRNASVPGESWGDDPQRPQAEALSQTGPEHDGLAPPQGFREPRRAGQRTFSQPEDGEEEPPFGLDPGAFPEEEDDTPFPSEREWPPRRPAVAWPSTVVPPAPRFDRRGHALRGDTPWYKQQLMPEAGMPEAQTGFPTGEVPQAARARSAPPAGAAEHTAPGAAYEGLPGHWQRIR